MKYILKIIIQNKRIERKEEGKGVRRKKKQDRTSSRELSTRIYNEIK